MISYWYRPNHPDPRYPEGPPVHPKPAGGTRSGSLYVTCPATSADVSRLTEGWPLGQSRSHHDHHRTTNCSIVYCCWVLSHEPPKPVYPARIDLPVLSPNRAGRSIPSAADSAKALLSLAMSRDKHWPPNGRYRTFQALRWGALPKSPQSQSGGAQEAVLRPASAWGLPARGACPCQPTIGRPLTCHPAAPRPLLKVCVDRLGTRLGAPLTAS